MPRADLKSFLMATPFFGGLLDASLEKVIGMLVERRFAEGATVVSENDEGRSMYVVEEGELVVSKKSGSGRIVRISRLGPGDFFGEMTLIEIQRRSASVVAHSPAVLFELSAASLYVLYEADVHAYAMVLQNMNRELCRRLRRADERITELADVAYESAVQIQRGSL
jgi:CRP/FNR family transcriptional regulator, cyclic AMP receptor protein